MLCLAGVRLPSLKSIPSFALPPPSKADAAAHSGARDRSATLDAIFEAQVRRSPAAIAVQCGQRSVSYRELNGRANRLAHRLVRIGVAADAPVGICLERSVEMIVAVLAVLKAGGACVPLDPAYPPERLAFMLADARPRVVLTQASLRARLGASSVAHLCLDTEAAALAGESAGDPPLAASPLSLAYLIYTSGSTGQPKAVAMEHAPLCNLLRWQARVLPGPARTLQFASLSFDVSFQEIFSTLHTGGTLLPITEEIRRDPAALLRLIEQEKIERLFLPFVALQQLAVAAAAQSRAPRSLRHVVTAGEQLRITPQIRALFTALPACTLHNHYGPTESHVVTAHTLAENPEKWPALAPIGRPIDGATIHLLDAARQPVEPGETGELYIGGACLARGYQQRAELTAARFIRDPCGARLYRSGDLARQRPDGVLEFLGRIDDQIKIRGVRVEPAEVEAALALHPALEHVAVVAQDDGEHGSRLSAYFVAKEGCAPAPRELRLFLHAKLPPSLLPSTFTALAQMPLTPSGKVDRHALPAPRPHPAAPPVAPRSQLERELVAIWEKSLRVAPIGIHDDFFEWGGDSLRALEIAVALDQACARPVPVAKIYEHPTIEALAAALEGSPIAGPEPDVTVLNATGARPAFFCILGTLDLGRFLGADQPYVRVNVTPANTTSVRSAIEEMAGHAVRAIRAAQAHGPYRIGGYSLGGFVASEAAQQLHRQGEEIALLALIEPDPPRPARCDRWMRDVRQHGWRAFIRQRAASLLRTVASPPATAPARSYAEMPLEEKVFCFPGHYRAPLCPGPMALFLAGDSPASADSDPRYDWRKAARHGCEVHEIPGNHLSIVEEPGVRVLAERLRAALQGRR